ncbi:MAG: tetratricopeptide repeat protein [Crocinitomicaceae bacterium]|nr:tetratricopeptide repeat protein [Crocinitomicaceae bacterium]
MYEEPEEEFDGNLKEDIQRFEAFLLGDEIGFLDSDRWEALIDHWLVSAQYQKALTCAEEALSQFSFNTTFKLRKAQAYSATGKLKESIQLLSELERIGIPSFEILLTKASVFSQLKDSQNAIKYFIAALKASEPEDRDEIYIDLAMEYEQASRWEDALKVLKEAIKANPNNEGAIYEIAFCHDQIGQYDESIQCYSDFIDENPYSFTAWYNLGNAYLKMENYEKAVWAYDYCTLINDDFGPVHFNMGNAYLSLDKFRKAIECFDRSNELDGDDPTGLCYIGECHEQLGEFELAKHYYKRSLELSPQLPDAWLGLGIVEDLEGRTKEGLVLIHKASELSPDNAGIYHVLAGAYEKMDEFQLAYEYYEMAIALDPYDEECLINFVGLISKEAFVTALDYLDSFKDEYPDSQMVDVLRVNVLWQMGRKDSSLFLFKECLTRDREKACELFDINPSLKTVQEFVLLTE